MLSSSSTASFLSGATVESELDVGVGVAFFSSVLLLYGITRIEVAHTHTYDYTVHRLQYWYNKISAMIVPPTPTTRIEAVLENGKPRANSVHPKSETKSRTNESILCVTQFDSELSPYIPVVHSPLLRRRTCLRVLHSSSFLYLYRSSCGYE